MTSWRTWIVPRRLQAHAMPALVRVASLGNSMENSAPVPPRPPDLRARPLLSQAVEAAMKTRLLPPPADQSIGVARTKRADTRDYGIVLGLVWAFRIRDDGSTQSLPVDQPISAGHERLALAAYQSRGCARTRVAPRRGTSRSGCGNDAIPRPASAASRDRNVCLWHFRRFGEAPRQHRGRHRSFAFCHDRASSHQQPTSRSVFGRIDSARSLRRADIA